MRESLLIPLNALAMIGMLVFACSFGSWDEPPHPSDQKLEAVFLAHENEFEQLVVMSNADRRMMRIDPRFTYPESDEDGSHPERKSGLSKERWDEYRRLFAQLGLVRGLYRFSNGKGEAVEFIASARGMLPGTSKGFVYSTTDLSPVVDSLDAAVPTAKEGFTYKKIKDHWYLCYDY